MPFDLLCGFFYPSLFILVIKKCLDYEISLISASVIQQWGFFLLERINIWAAVCPRELKMTLVIVTAIKDWAGKNYLTPRSRKQMRNPTNRSFPTYVITDLGKTRPYIMAVNWNAHFKALLSFCLFKIYVLQTCSWSSILGNSSVFSPDE